MAIQFGVLTSVSLCFGSVFQSVHCAQATSKVMMLFFIWSSLEVGTIFNSCTFFITLAEWLDSQWEKPAPHEGFWRLAQESFPPSIVKKLDGL
ncbi:hypothetical protein MKW98_014258 [Papaver atlanticum]|uniref:Uncharacterized protein n=1 Tax=Papaver atlanticum TaxID=357466 RepID=A0AAD4SXY0_9MAGN|nr:hypothetical protein MKW98_014258 [Papaver atlanticum]